MAQQGLGRQSHKGRELSWTVPMSGGPENGAEPGRAWAGPHNELAAIGFLVDAGEACKRVEELHDTLFLPQRGVLLERLLDHLSELLGLRRDSHRDALPYPTPPFPETSHQAICPSDFCSHFFPKA